MSWPSRKTPRRRRDRGMGIGGLMVQIAKAQARKKAGEIHTCPNGYALSEQGWTNAGGVFIAPRPTADGRMASLLGGLRSATNCPKPPGDFPIFTDDRGTHNWVPMKDCRKCPHHIARSRGRAYPCCEVLRELAAAEPGPVEKATSMYAEAVRRTKEMLG